MSMEHHKLHGKYKIPQKFTFATTINGTSVQGHLLQSALLPGEAVESVGSLTPF